MITPKRFWTKTEVTPVETGYSVTLDERPIKTPAKATLIVPSRALANAICEEWDALEDKIDPSLLVYTRMANVAIDRLPDAKGDVVAMLAAYAGDELLTYRVETPLELAKEQEKHWTPLLDWAYEQFNARLYVSTGVMPVNQDAEALHKFSTVLQSYNCFELAAIHDFITITGSLILGLAVAHQRLTAVEAWEISRLDENWQIAQWGDDDEASEKAFEKQEALKNAENFIKFLKD